ncbi:hypothetical protein [Streptomyces sp. SP18CS02]|uniref:hypothetical protein n=1 Tax=Streptomyces sp. SP18CS02 TaxID=3002531 RepID=UPI002E77FC1E|nr:hypothetical protein [Streptomyces sp. SP18CS02]MEE1752939.1 hypothetical protein [Streptomyces sp. SP18CS02]
MVIAWSGVGCLTFPIVVLGLVGGGAMGDRLLGNETLGGALGGGAACLVLWFWGRYLNRNGDEHTMWAVPMHWWGAFFLLFGAATAMFVLLYGA